MSVTPNFSWPLIEPTDFVTNLPADLETLADDIDSDVWAIKQTADAALPETLIDAAGDLIYGSAADTAARLAIGTAGQVLAVNSGATAPEWVAAPAGWSPNLTLLNAGGTALTGASTITVNVSSYDYYHIFVDTVSSANAAAFSLRLNGDSGSNYGWVRVGFLGTAANSQSNLTSSYALAAIDSAGDNAASMITILGGKTSGLKSITSTNSTNNMAGTSRAFAINGYYAASAAITSISIISSSGNFDQGTLYIYGG